MASWTVLYLTGTRRVRLVQRMSELSMLIFLMRLPVIFHSVRELTRLPVCVGT